MGYYDNYLKLNIMHERETQKYLVFTKFKWVFIFFFTKGIKHPFKYKATAQYGVSVLHSKHYWVTFTFYRCHYSNDGPYVVLKLSVLAYARTSSGYRSRANEVLEVLVKQRLTLSWLAESTSTGWLSTVLTIHYKNIVTDCSKLRCLKH